jgi:dienelactone hydrolase
MANPRPFALLLVFPALLAAQKLEVTPTRALVDAEIQIRATGLQPNERISIRAELMDGADNHWSSQAEFLADAQGSVDASKQAPVAGSYREVSSMGLVWAMLPEHKEGRYTPPRNFGAQMIEFHLMRGGARLADAKYEQDAIADGVQRTPLHEGRLRGTLFLPPGTGPHPALLVLGGSEGGLPARRAAWLASHGYAALALAYFRYDDLPQLLMNIPLEYFGEALAWMMHRPEIAPDRIGVTGVSRGAELALQLGSMYPQIKAVAAFAPSNVRNPACCGMTAIPWAWSWEGQGLAFRNLRGGPGPALALQAQITVEKTHGPILLLSGGEDGVWDSSSMADLVASRLKHNHFEYDVVHLHYPHAGHTVGRPEIVPAWSGEVRNPTSGREMNLGGSPKGNAESSIDAIPKTLEFLQKSLGAH